MSETSGTAVVAGGAVETQAQVIERAVETALEETAPAAVSPVTSEATLNTARGIYLAWRNGNLGGLPPDAFNRVEAASASLIAEIAAKLAS